MSLPIPRAFPYWNGEYVLLPDGTIRPPIDHADWVFWTGFGRVLGWYTVRFTRVGPFEVYTSFVTFDQNLLDDRNAPGYRPLVFESMAFGPGPTFQRRYQTRRRAVAGHRAVVQAVKAYLKGRI